MFVLEYFVCSLFFFGGGLYFYISGLSFWAVWEVFSLEGYSLGIHIYMDYYTLIFVGTILSISSMIILYSYGYVDCYSSRFFCLMNLFVVSMILLVISPNFFSMIMGWDGLGIISFCLVGFYYGSGRSISSAVVTMLYNRVGDALLILVISSLFLCDGLWESGICSWGVLISLLGMLGLCTKSAQYPFSSWLPQAMAAPTPVSSLVHSSTLVTAGMYMLFRYNDMLGLSMGGLLFISLLTMVSGGVMSFLSYDIKKIIAYSTLSQMGFMISCLSVGSLNYMFFHMIIHAFFKSMMFMCSGIIIHVLGGCQDIRLYGGVYKCFPMSFLSLMIGLMGLIGFPYISGFYSKDLVLMNYLSGGINLLEFGVFNLGMILTISYGTRLLCYLIGVGGLSLSGMICAGESIMSGCLFFLSFMVLFIGCLMNLLYWDWGFWGGDLEVLVSLIILFYILVGGSLGVVSGLKLFDCCTSGGPGISIPLGDYCLDCLYYLLKLLGLILGMDSLSLEKSWVEDSYRYKLYSGLMNMLSSGWFWFLVSLGISVLFFLVFVLFWN